MTGLLHLTTQRRMTMPYLPNDRQYRTFAANNFQSIATRTASEGDDEPSYTVRGHYTVFDYEYPLTNGFYETIDRHALDDTDTSDVLFQFNHTGTPLARLRNGSLRIGVDQTGGWAEADLSGCQQARDIYEAISNGLIDRMSFGFTVDADEVSEEREKGKRTIYLRTITRIGKLYDVSAVSIPANDGTEISARSLVDGLIEKEKAERLIEAEKEARARAKAELELELELIRR
jgi:HK97 family phage prohead protease